MQDPREMLIRLSVTAEAGLPLAPDVADWLNTGLQRFLAGEPLEAALGVAKPGRFSLPATVALAERNGRLMEAAEILGLREDRANAWDVAGRLAAELKKIETRVWPREKDAPPPPSADTLRDVLLTAFHSYAPFSAKPVPTGRDHLYRLLRH